MNTPLKLIAPLDARGRITTCAAKVVSVRVQFAGGFEAVLPFPKELLR